MNDHRLSPARIKRARNSVYLIFTVCGFSIGSVQSRIPQIRDNLHLNKATLGYVLLMIGVGSVISLPTAGAVVRRFGPSNVVAVMGTLCLSGIIVAGLGTAGSTLAVGLGFFMVGLGAGQWDVAQNVEAAEVERQLGVSVMSRFHAAFSVGAAVGGLVGLLMNFLNVAPRTHLVIVGLVLIAGLHVGVAGFTEVPETDVKPEHHKNTLSFWKEPRTLLIGLFVMCMAFAEGSGNEWLGVATKDELKMSKTWGTFAYVAFGVSMTLGRFVGPRLLDQFGRVPVLRASAASAVAGTLLFVFAPTFAVAVPGILLWGVGTALGFPTGMSAAADDASHAEGRVSTVATIGYLAFLAGPPLLGTVSEHIGIRHALLVTTALVMAGFFLANATKPLPGTSAAIH